MKLFEIKSNNSNVKKNKNKILSSFGLLSIALSLVAVQHNVLYGVAYVDFRHDCDYIFSWTEKGNSLKCLPRCLAQ